MFDYIWIKLFIYIYISIYIITIFIKTCHIYIYISPINSRTFIIPVGGLLSPATHSDSSWWIHRSVPLACQRELLGSSFYWEAHQSWSLALLVDPGHGRWHTPVIRISIMNATDNRQSDLEGFEPPTIVSNCVLACNLYPSNSQEHNATTNGQQVHWWMI